MLDGEFGDIQMGDVTVAHKPRFISKKRPPASDAEIYERKIKRIRERLQLGSPMESNAVMVLNEYDKDLKYELVEQVGPIHNPSFTVQLVVNGQVSAVVIYLYCLVFPVISIILCFDVDDE